MQVLTHNPSRHRADEVQVFAVYLLTFPIFLMAALVGRLRPGRRPARAERVGQSLSVIQEAKASAQTCGSFSLMG